jgi:outer membrane protein TolC
MRIFILFFIFTKTTYAADPFIEQLIKSIGNDPDSFEIESQKEYRKKLKLSAQTKLFLPTLSASTSKVKAKSTFNTNESEYQTTSLTLEYSLFNFGSDYLRYKSQKSSLNAFHSTSKVTKIKSEYTIAKLLLTKIKLLSDKKIQEEVISLKERSFAISRQRFKRGNLSKNDLLIIKINLSNSRSQLASLRQQIHQTDAQLTALNTQSELKSFPWISLFKKKGIKNTTLLNFDEAKNPELLNYKYLAQSHTNLAISEKRKHLGRFDISYSRDLYQQDETDDLYGHSTALTYTLPLFENFNQDKLIQQSKAKATTAEYIYDYQKRKIQADVKHKKATLQSAFQDFQERLTTLNDANFLFSNVLKRFKKGVLNVNDLILEQDRLLATKKITTNSIFNLHLSYIEFIHVNGLLLTENAHFFNNKT